MNNGYLQRVIEWRDKAKHDGTWGSTNVSGMYPYEVIDTLIDQLAEARELHSKTYDEYQRLLAEARAEVAELKATIQPGCCGIATCPGVAEARQEVAREIVDMLFDTEFEGPNKAKFEKVVAAFISHIKSKFKLEG